jgi:hypothetical protein
MATALSASLAGVVLSACQTQPDRDLGELGAEQSLDLQGQPPEAAEPFGVPPADFAGRWIGVAEDPLALGGARDVYTFPSGAAQIALELSAGVEDGGATLLGTITFGSGSPPPALNPDLGQPSDYGYSDLAYFSGMGELAAGYTGPLPPYEGHAYHTRQFAEANHRIYPALLPQSEFLADGVLRVEFNTEELIAPWCGLQQPRTDGYGGFSCVKGNALLTDEAGQCFVGFSGLTPEEEALVAAQGESLQSELVDCGKLFLCASRRCECDETHCSSSLTGVFRSMGELALRRDGDNLIGVFSNVAFFNERQLTLPPGAVRFTRAE